MNAVPSAGSTPISTVIGEPVARVAADATVADVAKALDVASTKLVWCDAETTVDEVAVRMMDRYIRHILVEQDDGALVGIVSARDLLGVYSAEADLGFGSA